jgi:hypothetical protein
MENFGRMDIFQTSKDLIKEELAMFICKWLRRFDNGS